MKKSNNATYHERKRNIISKLLLTWQNTHKNDDETCQHLLKDLWTVALEGSSGDHVNNNNRSKSSPEPEHGMFSSKNDDVKIATTVSNEICRTVEAEAKTMLKILLQLKAKDVLNTSASVASLAWPLRLIAWGYLHPDLLNQWSLTTSRH